MVSILPVPECAGCEEACEATVRRFPQHCCWRLTRDWPTERSSSIVCHHMQRLPLWQGLLTAEENKFQLTYACTSPTLSNTEKYPTVAHLCPHLWPSVTKLASFELVPLCFRTVCSKRCSFNKLRFSLCLFRNALWVEAVPCGTSADYGRHS